MLFRKSGSSSQTGGGAAITSIVGQEMQLVGDVSFKGKLRLDGKVEGNIRGEHLILGETGVVVGDIVADTLFCSGRVQGNVKVEKLHLIKGGAVNGKVEASDLEVESGAVLNGEIASSSKDLRLVPGSSTLQEGLGAGPESVEEEKQSSSP